MSWNRPDESRFGIHSIDHFTLEVPSLDKARHFFENFGLIVGGGEGGLTLQAAGSDHVWVRLLEGPRKHLSYLSLSCWADEFDGLRAQIEARGVELLSPDAVAGSTPPGGSGQGIWLRDPHGHLLQVKIGPKTTPSGLAPRTETAPRPGQRGVLGHRDQTTIRPRRLSHVMLFSPDLDRSIDFYRDVLGLRLSDRSQGAVAFLHARHGSDHHLVAFAGSSAPGFHHSSWDVDGIHEVGEGAQQMRKAGYAEGWGTGRHVLGSNFFHYVRDPWGSFAEYSADIDFVPVGATWPAGNFPIEDSLYLWGPDVPSYFTANSEA